MGKHVCLSNLIQIIRGNRLQFTQSPPGIFWETHRTVPGCEFENIFCSSTNVYDLSKYYKSFIFSWIYSITRYELFVSSGLKFRPRWLRKLRDLNEIARLISLLFLVKDSRTSRAVFFERHRRNWFRDVNKGKIFFFRWRSIMKISPQKDFTIYIIRVSSNRLSVIYR